MIYTEMFLDPAKRFY